MDLLIKIGYAILYIPIFIGSIPVYIFAVIVGLIYKLFHPKSIFHMAYPHDVIIRLMEELFND